MLRRADYLVHSAKGMALPLAILLLPTGAIPAVAQDVVGGRAASSAVGQVGERRSRQQTGASIQPMARIDSRIQNRVQSRIHNRIDRYYDPNVDTTSPFKMAGDQVRTAGKGLGR